MQISFLNGMIVMLLALGFAHAAPLWGKSFQLSQPNGSQVSVQVWGDEFYQHVESPEGDVLVRNNQGWICVARLSADGKTYEPTNQIYQSAPLPYNPAPLPRFSKAGHRLEERVRRRHPMVNSDVRESIIKTNKQRLGSLVTSSSALLYQAAPAEPDERLFRTGTIRALTILVDFSDEPASMPKAELDSLYNQIGYSKYGNNGSVRDYFRDVSLNKIDLQWDFVGYVRAPKPKWYYDNPTMTTSYEHTWEFINDVVRIADEQYDFSTLTKNPYNNNSVLSLTIMYAGNPAGGWTMGLWPHAGYLGITLDGQWIQGYSCVNIGNMALEIGTIAHEAGHSIGNYADFYDMDGGGAGTGTYDLMGTGGGGNPPPLGPHNLMQSGWANVIDVSWLEKDSTLILEKNTNTVLRYVRPDGDEQFYVEMRFNSKRPTPAEGILIWHADGTYGVNNNCNAATPTCHYWMSVTQADGRYDLERGINWGDSEDSWRSGYKNAFTVNTMPSSRWWDGTDSKFSLTEISSLDSLMTVKVGSRPGLYTLATPIANVAPGLEYEAVAGVFENINAVHGAPYLSGIASFADISLSGKADYFAMTFRGYIRIPQTGYYTFYLNSDDGSRFTLDGVVLIDHDGLHDANATVSNTVGLVSGMHPVEIKYFENAGGEALYLSWSSNVGLAKESVPSTVWFHEIVASSSSRAESSSSTVIEGICATAEENTDLVLECGPREVIDTIVFANYGVTLGGCGSYRVGTCQASSSLAEVESRCEDQSSCRVVASNQLFGDPCMGILKNLTVQYRCRLDLPVFSKPVEQVRTNNIYKSGFVYDLMGRFLKEKVNHEKRD